jgi:Rho termination factor, N-terminal domain
MTKAELESKHLAELHALAAEAGVPRYRMLRREELVEKLAGETPARAGQTERTERSERPERKRPPRRRRERPARETPSPEQAASKAPKAEPRPEPRRERVPATEPAAAESGGTRPRRRRRRRRFGRKGKGVRAHDLLLPPPGRQALVYGESSAACTALLREIAGELSGASKGPDPIALLVDPSPEELAEWKREAPQAEIVAAGKARHASDALAQATRRAGEGEDVILLVDSLTRLDDAETAKQIFDGGLNLTSASGSLTVVAAIERQS